MLRSKEILCLVPYFVFLRICYLFFNREDFLQLEEANMDFKGVKDYFSWLYYQYQIISCCAVLEPWEQSMFNTILLTIFAMVVYTAYVFIPIHIRLAWEFFSKICGYQGIVSNWSCLYSMNGHHICICCLHCIDLGGYSGFFHYLTWKALSSMHLYILPEIWHRFLFTCYIVRQTIDNTVTLPHLSDSLNLNLGL